MVKTEFSYENQGKNLTVKVSCDKVLTDGVKNLVIDLYDEEGNLIELGELPFNRKEWVRLEEYATDRLMEEEDVNELRF